MARRARQLELDLRERARWGGRRAGAGRKCGPSPRHAHRARAPLAARELERSFAAACERGRFRLVQYSVQHDHLHAIVEATSQRDLASGMKSIGARIARAVNRIFGRRGPALEDRYHLHVLRTPAEVRRALAYLLLNARRHLAKLGKALPRVVQLDPASSGRFFSGWNRRFQPASSLDPPPVAPPHTWLLSIGWRRHGLIDPAEVPGRASGP